MIKAGFVLLSALVLQVWGHGMLLEPPNRSSLWRFDPTSPINYNDNQNFCGGFSNQWSVNGGKCGVCGDDYSADHPQDNEHTGYYGEGKIVATYKSGQIIETAVTLTANHMGYFEYSLCEIKNENEPESGEDCFKVLSLADGTTQYPIESTVTEVNNQVQLPKGFKCKHCVLRWHYNGGNSWGQCEDGSTQMGCGPQEIFRSCSDISIV